MRKIIIIQTKFFIQKKLIISKQKKISTFSFCMTQTLDLFMPRLINLTKIIINTNKLSDEIDKNKKIGFAA